MSGEWRVTISVGWHGQADGFPLAHVGEKARQSLPMPAGNEPVGRRQLVAGEDIHNAKIPVDSAMGSDILYPVVVLSGLSAYAATMEVDASRFSGSRVPLRIFTMTEFACGEPAVRVSCFARHLL